ncbi:MAG TPA: acireductone synthase [Dokdonella sp.]|uniref:acireductone synthase n=1 Tax=Dokdonella sp. TaxID=2291710 RepID=UPI002D7F60F0|nr:acireductone synthase [Dokdonella sp.]HET9034099.1 acireductone synthase [Dokdonella sp.]
MSRIRAILTDIEGTTSSISFVKDVLFPYARKRLPAFVVTHADTPEVQHWLQEAAREAGLVSADEQEIIDLLISWIDSDRKSTALKALQGMIWADGYKGADFRAHIYEDAARCLQKWAANGLRLYVYSSGSVPAQKLLFGNTEAGDLSPLFSGYFDTETGAKRESASYARIAEAIALPAAEILFLSDVVDELDAAQKAGMQTILLARDANGCAADSGHRCVVDFDAIDPNP